MDDGTLGALERNARRRRRATAHAGAARLMHVIDARELRTQRRAPLRDSATVRR
jgi:hypothetical protein